MTDAAVSMAILTVDANRLGRGVLSRFEPMVLDRLYHSRTDVVAIPDLRQEIEDEFGLGMPGTALQTISRRAARKGVLKREHGVLHIDRGRLAKFDLSGVRAATSREYEALMFPSTRATPRSPSRVRDQLREAQTAIGTTVTPHDLRRTVATQVAN